MNFNPQDSIKSRLDSFLGSTKSSSLEIVQSGLFCCIVSFGCGNWGKDGRTTINTFRPSLPTLLLGPTVGCQPVTATTPTFSEEKKNICCFLLQQKRSKKGHFLFAPASLLGVVTIDHFRFFCAAIRVFHSNWRKKSNAENSKERDTGSIHTKTEFAAVCRVGESFERKQRRRRRRWRRERSPTQYTLSFLPAPRGESFSCTALSSQSSLGSLSFRLQTLPSLFSLPCSFTPSLPSFPVICVFASSSSSPLVFSPLSFSLLPFSLSPLPECIINQARQGPPCLSPPSLPSSLFLFSPRQKAKLTHSVSLSQPEREKAFFCLP